jgi:hypothetical protein
LSVRIEKTIDEQTIHLSEGVPCPLTLTVLGVFQREFGQSLELVDDFLAVLHFYPSGRAPSNVAQFILDAPDDLALRISSFDGS